MSTDNAKQDVKSFDYIICGYVSHTHTSATFPNVNLKHHSGGTAGCVIAGRLAEKSHAAILLIEAGPPRDSVPASAVPAG
jgi:hypothetical protein